MRAKLRALLPRNRFVRSVAVLAGGTALGQAVVLLAKPAVTRLYSPADFGVLAAFASVLTMLTMVSALRYDMALPLPERDEEAADLFGAALVALAGVAALTAAAVGLAGAPLTAWARVPELAPFLWLLPVGLVFSGLYQLLTYWAARQKVYGDIARTKLTQGCGLAGAQVGLGLAGVGPLGLILGHLVGQASGGGNLLRGAWRRDGAAFRQVTPAGMRAAAWRYRKFPMFATAAAILNSAGAYLPALLLVGLYGKDTAGWFALSQEVIGAPIALIGQAAGHVFVREAAELAARDGRALESLFNHTAARLAAVGVVPAVVLIAAGPWLFATVFGENWREAGRYTQLLAATAFAQLITQPISHVVNVLHRQGLQLALDGLRVLLVVGVFGAAAAGLGPATAVGLYAAAMTLTYAVSFGLYWVLVRRRARVAGP